MLHYLTTIRQVYTVTRQVDRRTNVRRMGSSCSSERSMLQVEATSLLAPLQSVRLYPHLAQRKKAQSVDNTPLHESRGVENLIARRTRLGKAYATALCRVVAKAFEEG